MATVRAQHERAFTLMELMVVVVIIGVLAVLAIPSMLGGQNERHAFRAAADISAILREGRSRAMGRGVAVAATLDSSSDEMHIVLLEDPLSSALDGGAIAAQVGGCKGTDWNAAAAVGRVDIAGGVYAQAAVKSRILIGGAAKTKAVLCFAPSGRTFLSEFTTDPNQVRSQSGMVDPLEIEVGRKPAGAFEGIVRTVIVTPAGATRTISR
jgi:prepilin-type N-terminal cleavage/methylation domain-containing protein